MRARLRYPYAAAALAATLAATPAGAQDTPRLKPGLWEVSTRTSTQKPGDPPLSSTMCLDEVTSRELYRYTQGMMEGLCSKFEVRHTGNRYSSEAVCTIGGSKMASRSTMTMTVDTAYRIEGRSSYDPPFLGIAEATTTVDAKHVGGCRPGQKPGDITAAGQTINIRTLSRPAGK